MPGHWASTESSCNLDRNLQCGPVYRSLSKEISRRGSSLHYNSWLHLCLHHAVSVTPRCPALSWAGLGQREAKWPGRSGELQVVLGRANDLFPSGPVTALFGFSFFNFNFSLLVFSRHGLSVQPWLSWNYKISRLVSSFITQGHLPAFRAFSSPQYLPFLVLLSVPYTLPKCTLIYMHTHAYACAYTRLGFIFFFLRLCNFAL